MDAVCFYYYVSLSRYPDPLLHVLSTYVLREYFVVLVRFGLIYTIAQEFVSVYSNVVYNIAQRCKRLRQVNVRRFYSCDVAAGCHGSLWQRWPRLPARE